MLIGQDAADSPLLQKGGCSLHLLFPVEGGHTATPAVAVHKIIHLRAAQGLIDTSCTARFHEFRNLGVDLPIPKVTQGCHGAVFPGFPTDDPVLPLLRRIKAETGAEFFFAQGGDFDRGDDVRSEIGKMFSGEDGRFEIGQLWTEGNVEILFGESAVAG